MFSRWIAALFTLSIAFQTSLSAEFFTPEEVAAYHRRSLLQWNSAIQALQDNAFEGNERVLDIGCGDGKITAYIAERLQQGSIKGIDASQNMILFAIERFPSADHSNLVFEVGDANLIEYQGEFDTIVSFFCLHWLKNQELALKRIYTALRMGGKLVVATPTREQDDFLEMIYNLAKTPKWTPLFKDSLNTRTLYTAGEYEQFLLNAGFSNVDVQIKTIETVFSRELLRDWLRPIIYQQLNEEQQSEFLQDLMAITTRRYPVDQDGNICVLSRNLQATALKR